MIGFCPLASGSKGNCIYIGTASTKVLIDAGLSAKAIRERLKMIGVGIEEIDAILITHEHSDHIKGLEVLGRGIPVLANSETAKALYGMMDAHPKFRIFTTGEVFEFGEIEVRPFSVQHDAADPVAFVVKVGGMKVGFCADLGFVSTSVVHALQGCDYLYVEANHEVGMVHACNRPQVYKQRVLSRQGHLSNGECAELIRQVYHPGLKHIHLAHLSSECNHPERALMVVRNQLEELGAKVEVSIAWQDEVSQPISFASLSTSSP
ncbi:MAG: MBL fold metallo-hydrolase [Verrucomicrobia bacterium]|nr:MBL fold metallo-hydrolase [Verrucomicrobiota bacterium]